MPHAVLNLLSITHSCSLAIESFVDRAIVAILSAVQVIDIQILDKVHCLVIQTLALRRVIGLNVKLIPVEYASGLLYLVPQSTGYHVPVGKRFDHLGIRVEVHVSDTISNDETFEVVGIIPVVHLLHKVPLVDLPGKVGSVNSSIALSSNVKTVVSVVGEGLVEVLKADEGILRG